MWLRGCNIRLFDLTCLTRLPSKACLVLHASPTVLFSRKDRSHKPSVLEHGCCSMKSIWHQHKCSLLWSERLNLVDWFCLSRLTNLKEMKALRPRLSKRNDPSNTSC